MIPSREALEAEYDAQEPTWRDVLDKAKENLVFLLKYGGRHLQECPVKYLYITERVKSFDSVYAKAIRMNMSRPFEQMKDLLGLRIVCLYRTDVDQIADFIRTAEGDFRISKRSRSVPRSDTFGYDAEHYHLSHHFWSRDGNRAKAEIELQVRTILMDAWAAISHDLDYKREIDIPQERKRDFYALAGALYSVDTQFEELRLQRINYAKRMMQDLVSGRISKQLELNREHLSIYIATKFPEVETPDYAVEIIENSLRGDGIVTIKKLDDILNLTADASRDPELEEEGPVFEPLYVIHQIVVATMLYDIRLARLCKSPEENRVIIEKYEGVRRKYGLDKYPEALE